MKPVNIVWSSMNTGDVVSESEFNFFRSDTPPCFRCNKPAHYCEGQTDETMTGNAVYSFWYACFDCEVESQLFPI